jgi:hypothetical protein
VRFLRDAPFGHQSHRTSHPPTRGRAFKLEPKGAQDVFRRWIAGRWFAPNALKETVKSVNGVRGVYLPCWTFDARTTSDYQGQRGIDRVVQERRRDAQGNTVIVNRTETDWYPASGTVSLSFDDTLVPASHSIRRTGHGLDRLGCVGNAALFRRLRRGLHGGSVSGRSRAGIRRSKRHLRRGHSRCRAANIGGHHQRVLGVATRYDNVTFKHILLPVWICSYQFKGRSWRVVVNGQTGAVKGDRPWSAWKIGFAVLTLLAVAATVYLLQQDSCWIVQSASGACRARVRRTSHDRFAAPCGGGCGREIGDRLSLGTSALDPQALVRPEITYGKGGVMAYRSRFARTVARRMSGIGATVVLAATLATGCAPSVNKYAARSAAADSAVKEALKSEQTIRPTDIPTNTVGVMPLTVRSADTTYASLGYGVSACGVGSRAQQEPGGGGTVETRCSDARVEPGDDGRWIHQRHLARSHRWARDGSSWVAQHQSQRLAADRITGRERDERSASMLRSRKCNNRPDLRRRESDGVPVARAMGVTLSPKNSAHSSSVQRATSQASRVQ